jgi:hypothetical protein
VTGFSKRKLISSALLGAWTHKRAGKYWLLEFYAHHMLRFARDWVMGEAEGQKMIHAHGFTIANLSSRLTEGGRVMKRKAKTQINRVM